MNLITEWLDQRQRAGRGIPTTMELDGTPSYYYKTLAEFKLIFHESYQTHHQEVPNTRIDLPYIGEPK